MGSKRYFTYDALASSSIDSGPMTSHFDRSDCGSRRSQLALSAVTVCATQVERVIDLQGDSRLPAAAAATMTGPAYSDGRFGFKSESVPRRH
jgi:hypothetical protein